MNERWSLAPGHVPSTLALIVLGLCGAVAVAEAAMAFARRSDRIDRRTAFAALGLRLLAIGAVFAVAFELTLRLDHITDPIQRVVVLVDRSASIAVPDATELGAKPETRQARIERVWSESAGPRSLWRDRGISIDVRGFDSVSEPITGEAAETLATTPVGTASDLTGAIATLLGDAQRPDDRVAAVIVLSDGLVGGLDSEAATTHLLDVAGKLGVPVTTVAVGAPALRDVAVADVRAGEFAFVENVTELETTIVAHGLEGTSAAVALLRNGERIAERKLRLRGDGVPNRIEFEVAPDRVGQFVYEIAVDEIAGEATLANNRRAFVVKVLRDKVRVLHVAGRPDWDVRALRTLLRRDPNVELLSYYILRDFDDIAREDTDALSLIPFPTEELFESELGSFDVVVLHNFDAVPHQVAQYIDNIAQFVDGGGALVLIGGDLGFSDGGYGTPAIARQLPIDVRRAPPLRHERVRPVLTEAGRRHPITAWLLAGDGRGWEPLPELDAWNPVGLTDRDDIGAITLLAHPDELDARGRPRPIVAVSEPGKGRVVTLATGSTWRLGFAPELALVDGARPYDLLWLGVVRWLLRDDTSGRLSLETDKPRYRAGESVKLVARTATAAYAPEPSVPVQWRIEPLAQDAKPTSSGSWTTDAQGRAEETVEALEIGAYRATAAREGDGGSEVTRVFIVEPPGRELARIDADSGTARMRRLAETTGGAFIEAVAGHILPDDVPVGEAAEDSRARVGARREIALWGGPMALVVLLFAFGGEWWLRRRVGVA